MEIHERRQRKAEDAINRIEDLFKKPRQTPKEIYTFIDQALELLRNPHIEKESVESYIYLICRIINTHASELKKFETLDDDNTVYSFAEPIIVGAVKLPNLKLVKTLYENGFDLTFDSDYAFYTLLMSDDKCEEKCAVAQYMMEKGCSLRKYMTNICLEVFEGINDTDDCHAVKQKKSK